MPLKILKDSSLLIFQTNKHSFEKLKSITFRNCLEIRCSHFKNNGYIFNITKLKYSLITAPQEKSFCSFNIRNCNKIFHIKLL